MDAEPAVKTYRYLRIAMIALVIGLATAVLYEWLQVDGRCLKTSISAYYYTPARPMFVAALVAIGVCLVCLQGNTDAEDALLNVAGMLAPVVAFVPTPLPGSCDPSFALSGSSSPSVGNNVTALLVIGLVAIVVAAVIGVVEGQSAVRWLGIGGAACTWVAATAWFRFGRSSFEANAHYTAAISMFVAIIAVVGLNALHFGRAQRARGARTGRWTFANRYAAIATAMVVSVLVVLSWKWSAGFAHWVLAIEAALISLFACFWVLQTLELWSQGLRHRPSESTPPMA